MVRNEIDIIESMIEHHLDQGIDFFVVTDNGSTDGTFEYLRELSQRGIIDLRQDVRHLKQQSECVTQMARDAYSMYEATWVINSDADEFWVPMNRAVTLRKAFLNIDTDIESFSAPVTNMNGPPAASGSGLQRLVYPDRRTRDELRMVGITGPPTQNAVHIGSPDVEVGQGNHIVSIASRGNPKEDWAIEVLHYPWRSWSQYSSKVRDSGLAYEANPSKLPSPNHHGMRDFAHFKEGSLLLYYLARSLSEDALGNEHDASWMPDFTIADSRKSSIPDEPLLEDLPLLTTRGRLHALRESHSYVALKSAELTRENQELRVQIAELVAEQNKVNASRLIRLAKKISPYF